MENDILLVLENIDESNYIDKIINSFSYEERLSFYNKMYSSKDSEVYSKLKYVLTDNEISEIIHEKFGYETVRAMVDRDSRRYLISLFEFLNIDNKVREFLKLDKSLMIYLCQSVFDTDELKKEFIDRLEKTEEVYNSLYRVMNSTISGIKDLSLKIKSIDEISSICPPAYLSSFIDIMDGEDVLKCFNDIELSDLTKSILILKCSSSKIAKGCFLKLNDDIAKVNAFQRFSQNHIEAVNDFSSDVDEYLDDNFTFEDLKEMFLSFKDKRILSILNFTDEEMYQFLPLVSEGEKIEILNEISDSRLLFSGLKYLNSVLSMTKVLTFFNGILPKYQEEYRKILVLYSNIYNVNVDHLIELSKIVSLEIVKHLENENIRSLINMDNEDFKKFISFFSLGNIKLNQYTLNNIFDTFANKAFNINYDYIRHYFTNVMLYVSKNDMHSAKEIIKKVFNKLDEGLINNYTVDSLYELLIKKDQKAKDDFHAFCNEYITIIRNEELKVSLSVYTEEYLDTSYEVTSSINTILKYGTPKWLYDKYLSKMLIDFSPREKSLLEDKDLFIQLYEFRINPVGTPPPLIKTNLFIFNQIVDKFYQRYKNDNQINQILEMSSIKKVPVVPDIDIEYLIDILSNLNADELKNRLSDNDDLCREVNKVFKKYSFLAFNSQFENIQLEADTYCDAQTVATIFLRYKDIMKELKKAKKEANMSSILDIADTHSKSSEIYKYIFESDNFSLISLNSQPNRSGYLRQKRREDSLKNYISCYRRSKVAVPVFDEMFNVNGKSINITVGNFTNPINLTLGERTGSCMRSGGVGDDLYNFCLNDDNGFHIVFYDPDTHEFITRVSGFRNGNTVFLNQLRDSVLDKYSSEDLIEAAKIVAHEIIGRSRNSEHAIDNVIISHDKAMEDYETQTVDIGTSNIFKGLNEHFWFDMLPNNAIVLASSNEDNSLVPLNLGKYNISYYKVLRDKIKLADNPTEAVKHIEALDQLLSGKKVENIKLIEEEYELCYYGEDWYVAVTHDGKMVKRIMSKTKDPESAFREMNIAFNAIENVNEIFKENKL